MVKDPPCSAGDMGSIPGGGTKILHTKDVKGVKPPMEFGEMTQDCFPGHAGKKALISR